MTNDEIPMTKEFPNDQMTKASPGDSLPLANKQGKL